MIEKAKKILGQLRVEVELLLFDPKTGKAREVAKLTETEKEVFDELRETIEVIEWLLTAYSHEQSMRQKLEGAGTIGLWVSVEDRLPMPGQDVLAYYETEDEARVIPANYGEDGDWYDCLYDREVEPETIAYWMSLPLSPKEETAL